MLADKSEIDESYLPSMCGLLKTFQYPFVKEKASDEIVYETVIVECLANLGINQEYMHTFKKNTHFIDISRKIYLLNLFVGYLFRTPNSDVRSEICSCIYNLLTYSHVPVVYSEHQRCSKSFLLKAVRSSDLPETLVKSLTLMEEDTRMRLSTMKILQVLSSGDATNCARMLDAQVASRLVLRMNYPAPSEEMLFRTIEIIWNLLETTSSNKTKVAQQLDSLVAVNQLRQAFLQQLLHGCSNYDRQLR